MGFRYDKARYGFWWLVIDVGDSDDDCGGDSEGQKPVLTNILFYAPLPNFTLPILIWIKKHRNHDLNQFWQEGKLGVFESWKKCFSDRSGTVADKHEGGNDNSSEGQLRTVLIYILRLLTLFRLGVCCKPGTWELRTLSWWTLVALPCPQNFHRQAEEKGF